MFHKEGYRIIMNTFILVSVISLLAEYKISVEWVKTLVQASSANSTGLSAPVF